MSETDARVFLGNISYDISEQELRRELEERGFSPTDLKIIVDRETQRSKGFAFASFATNGIADDVIRELDDELVGGRRIRTSRARPPQNGRRFEGRASHSRGEPRDHDDRGERGDRRGGGNNSRGRRKGSRRRRRDHDESYGW